MMNEADVKVVRLRPRLLRFVRQVFASTGRRKRNRLGDPALPFRRVVSKGAVKLQMHL